MRKGIESEELLVPFIVRVEIFIEEIYRGEAKNNHDAIREVTENL